MKYVTYATTSEDKVIHSRTHATFQTALNDLLEKTEACLRTAKWSPSAFSHWQAITFVLRSYLHLSQHSGHDFGRLSMKTPLGTTWHLVPAVEDSKSSTYQMTTPEDYDTIARHHHDEVES